MGRRFHRIGAASATRGKGVNYPRLRCKSPSWSIECDALIDLYYPRTTVMVSDSSSRSPAGNCIREAEATRLASKSDVFTIATEIS